MTKSNQISAFSYERVIAWCFSVVCCLVFLLALSMILTPNSYVSDLMLDQSGRLAPFPFTIPSLMWLVFFLAIFDAIYISWGINGEIMSLQMSLLPENEAKMLSADTVKLIFQNLAKVNTRGTYLKAAIKKSALQFLGSQSISRTNDVLRQTTDVYRDRSEVQMAWLRYVAWLLPTIGFIGTVIGISLALQTAGNIPNDMGGQNMRDWMGDLTSELALAFNTTLLALMLSAIVVLAQIFLESKSDLVLGRCEEYCIDNFINKLYLKK